MTTRVYVPTTARGLREAVGSRGIGPAPFLAHAVTDAVREALPDVGAEEWEYAAASAAAQASVALLHADEPARRVVLAVDVPEVRRAPASASPADPTLVEVAEAAPLRFLAAVLADSADAVPDVGAARDAVASASPEAERLLERCLDHEPGWWAAQEVEALLEDLARR